MYVNDIEEENSEGLADGPQIPIVMRGDIVGYRRFFGTGPSLRLHAWIEVRSVALHIAGSSEPDLR